VIGLERVTAILQAKRSVFEIDTIYPLIQQVRCFSKPLPIEFRDIEPTRLERTLVDHLRALLFLTVDGAPPPGKGGRARLMRILIREFLTSQRLLGISDRGFMRSMILTALQYYPQLAAAQDLLLEYVIDERRRFEHTVQAGMSYLEDRVDRNTSRLNMREIQGMEKEQGLPSSLIRYQLWQKFGTADEEHAITKMPVRSSVHQQ
jgi:alanyl-tRNA synthetase